MRAYQVAEFKGPEGLKQVVLPDPTPGHGEVLVRVHAVSLNYRDLAMAKMGEQQGRRRNLIPLSDGAGEIVAVGEGVTAWKPGDRVMANFFLTWIAGEIDGEIMKSDLGGGPDGMLTELISLPASALVPIPSPLSYEEAATLPCAALTAWQGLVVNGHLKAGETVLALGTGGVSIFALQIAKRHGARVIITSSSDEKLARAKELGADETINYRTNPDWEKEVYALTGKRGVDHVIEVGGAGTLERSLKAVRYGGHVSLIGILSGFGGGVNPWLITAKSLRVIGVYVGSVAMFNAMNRAITQAGLRPVIDRTFPFDEAPEAYRYLESGSHFGKVVIRVT